MIKAIIKRGHIEPLQPLPVDWQEGQSLLIERDEEKPDSLEVIDRDFAELNRLCLAGDSADDEIVSRSLQIAKRQAKEQVRRDMGLS